MLNKIKTIYGTITEGRWVDYPIFKTLSPYLRLMRLHQPAGIMLALWPAWWSIALNSKGIPSLWLLAIFGIGALAIRGAGCVINDIIDQRFDKDVERTKNRPLASGELSTRHAIRLLAILLAIGLVVLLQLPPLAQLIGLLAIVPVVTYPYMKRFTYWPQLFLGITFNLGVLIGGAAVTNSITLISSLLYLGAICWTLAYDTIYAHQDKEDDGFLGLKSTAIKFGEKTPTYIATFYQIAALLWAFAGMVSGISLAFFVFWGAAAYHMYLQITDLELDNPKSCGYIFASNSRVGLLLFAGAIVGWLF